MADPVSSFERNFQPEDRSVFKALVMEMVNEPVARVDKLYGGALSIHIGDLMPGRRKTRGRWVVTLWGGDIAAELEGRQTTSHTVGREKFADLLQQIVGRKLTAVDIRIDDWTLDLSFESDRVRLIVDPSFSGDSWMISLPTMQTIVMQSGGRWMLRLESDVISD